MVCSVVFQCLCEKTACAVYTALGLVKGSACPNCKNGYCLSPEAQYAALVEEQKKLGKVDMGLVSDGYHSFNDLYEHRYALFGALCVANKNTSWKSRVHSDGSVMEGYFIAGIQLVTGPVTYHIPLKYFDVFPAEAVRQAPEWDGHTSGDVVDRLKTLWDDPDTALFVNTIAFFGKDHQVNKSIEELAELIRALSKGDRDNIAEEMADVYVMLSQLSLIFQNKIKVSEVLHNKKTRLYRMITGKRDY